MPGQGFRRWVARVGTAPVLLGLVLFVPTSAMTAAPGLSGSVRDVLGNRLDDVEILVAVPAGGVKPLASARSDPAGLFTLSGLAPGVYRIAALKRGYGAFVGQVNTNLQSWVDLVLRPVAAIGPERAAGLPADPSWSLRLPRRSVLRESDAPLRDEDAVAKRSAADSDLPIQMKVDQEFALRQALGATAAARPDSDGMRTRLEIGSALGERGLLRFRGSRESYDASRGEGDETDSSREGASSLRVGLSYDTGPDSRVAMTAFYTEREYRAFDPQAYAPEGSSPHEGRSWGYDAAWTKQIDPLSSLAVKVDYLDASLVHPAGAMPGELGDPVPDLVSGRSVGAQGTYESVPASDHKVSVGVRARFVDSTFPLPETFREPEWSRSASGGPAGLSVGIEARDTWHVSGPFSAVYGLGYRHAITDRDPALIVPRIGGTWSFEPVRVRMLLSYHRVETSDDPATDPGPFRPGGGFGYEAEVEVPLAYGLRLSAEARSAPHQMDVLGYAGVTVSGARPRDPLYVTDGSAAVEHRGVALIRESAAGRASFEVAAGEVTGTVAPVLPYDLAAAPPSGGRLRYRTGRVGLYVAGSGTDIWIDYRAFDEGAAADFPAGGGTERTTVRLGVVQDLVRLDSLGAWRLMAAVRLDTLDDGRSDGAGTGTAGRRPGEDSREMSAGLSVLF